MSPRRFSVPLTFFRRRRAKLCETRKAERRPTCVDVLGVFERVGLESLRASAPLRAKALALALVDANAIVDVRELRPRYLASSARLVDECPTLAHELRMVDGVLRDSVCGLGAVRADKRLRRPTVFSDDRLKSCGVCVMNGRHSWMVAVEQRSIGSELGPDLLVIVAHPDQLVS